MRSAPAGTVKVMKPEDKQRALSEFMATGIAEAADTPTTDAARTVHATLIAHSPSSPAALALASLSAAGADVIIETRAIFASLDAVTAGAEPADTPRLTATLGRVVMRHITDVRLCDAHEQMVIGANATWIGDCLRRDPSKRDAYETFAPDDTMTRRFAELSFERIWALAVPVTVEGAFAGPPDDTTGDGDTPTVEVQPLPIDFAATAMIATRH